MRRRPDSAFRRNRALGGHRLRLGRALGHFHEYLVRGGFTQTAQVESITQAQRLLPEDIIDKVLKRDMTALFGVRRVLDLEHTFLSPRPVAIATGADSARQQGHG